MTGIRLLDESTRRLAREARLKRKRGERPSREELEAQRAYRRASEVGLRKVCVRLTPDEVRRLEEQAGTDRLGPWIRLELFCGREDQRREVEDLRAELRESRERERAMQRQLVEAQRRALQLEDEAREMQEHVAAAFLVLRDRVEAA